jgi:hypothetical protein
MPERCVLAPPNKEADGTFVRPAQLDPVLRVGLVVAN